MAKLTTTYDSTLKEKIFVLKGEEGYARSTDCILEEVLHNGERRADWNTDIKKMKLEFHIDVLRDIGASYVTLYDNEDVIDVYKFDTNTHAIDLTYNEDTGEDNRIELNYDVEHHIYAKYMGNKQCLKSQSKSYMVSEPLPASYKSTLEFIDMSTQYLTTDPITVQVQLKGADYYQDQDIVLFDNNTRIGTAKTDVNGNATFTIENVSEGVHTFLARFNGTDHLSSVEETMDTSVGVIFEFAEYPSYSINTQNVDVKLTANDYFGNPIPQRLGCDIGFYYNDQLYGIDNGYCENGVANLTIDYSIYSSVYIPSKFISVLYTDDSEMKLIKYSEEITITPYQNVTISLNQPSTLTGVNQSLTLTGQVSNVSEAVTVSLDNNIGTVKTDTNGNFSATYRGIGAGDVTVTASIGNVSGSVTVEDVIQYWSAPSNIINRMYSLHNATLSDLTNGFRLTLSNPDGGLILPFNYESPSIEFNILSINSIKDPSSNNPILFLWNSENSYLVGFTIKTSCKVKIDQSGFYVDGVKIKDIDWDLTYNGEIRIGVGLTNGNMLINNLKIKGVSQ